MQEKQRVKVYSTKSIISLAKSKRLTAMRASVDMSEDKDLCRNKLLRSGDKAEFELQQAREAVRQGVAKIKATYQQGMQNRLFTLRFGTDEEINQMTLQKLFNILNIHQSLPREFSQVKYGDS